MPFFLLVNLRGRTRRFPLTAGRHVIGSSGECDVHIKHPSVSRRHARLTVDEDEITVVDLDSSNGTRLDGKTVHGVTNVRVGDALRVGSVDVQLQRAEEGDLEVAVVFDQALEKESATVSRGVASTLGPAGLEAFSLNRLPDLVEDVARGRSSVEVARSVGAALLQTIPCASVEVVDISCGEPGIVFSASREVSGPVISVKRDAGAGYELRVEFVGRAVVEWYEPLIRVAAALIRASGRQAAQPSGMNDVEAPVPPEPPKPPSVVASFREIYRQAARVARGKVSVLIRGDSGTGKELLARYLHGASERAAAPLLTLNCAALPRDLLESELFGVERGVATGVEARAGKFEAAHGGTLFLDEIGDMAPETQARILRVLAEGEAYRIGGHQPRPADARVISATNRDLDAMVSDGRFRTDLFHRISDWVVELPPLRKRRADIPNLAAHFLGSACAERGVRVAGISRAAIDALMAYSWPGNVRQLEKEMARAALFLEHGEVLDTSRLQDAITAGVAPNRSRFLKDVREKAEHEHIELVLEECGGAVAEAAEILGVGISTLYGRMKDLGLS